MTRATAAQAAQRCECVTQTAEQAADTEPKRRGRPPKAPEEALTGRIPDRLPQDVADKYRRLGRDWLIDAVRQAKVPG